VAENISEKKEREYDLVVMGATGFTGKIIVNYLSRQYTQISWAIAGRSHTKLNTLAK